MKRSLIILCIFLFSYLFFYLMGAFIAWDLNLADWDPVSRLMTAGLGTVLGVTLAGLFSESEQWDDL